MLPFEEDYEDALIRLEKNRMYEKFWLIDYFEMYKTTLLWPDNLPPIPTINLEEGTFRKKFDLVYRKLLSNYKYELYNKTRSLKLK